jgi:hypothetical protein
MLEDLEQLKTLLDAGDLETTSEIIRYEAEHMGEIKTALKSAVSRLSANLKSDEYLHLSMFTSGYYMAMAKNGKVYATEADCEGSWGDVLTIEEYVDGIAHIRDARRLYNVIMEQVKENKWS